MAPKHRSGNPSQLPRDTESMSRAGRNERLQRLLSIWLRLKGKSARLLRQVKRHEARTSDEQHVAHQGEGGE
ncbi:MAG: hypothetical protein QOI39_4314 [Mycobacterium sp.]|jgi:hypothetical protein|nr:hypothetical protein [Mycobacterium sp.]